MKMFKKEKALNAWLIIFHLHDGLVWNLCGEEVLLSLNELSSQLLFEDNQMFMRNKQRKNNETFFMCFKTTFSIVE
jgi:hypothetical protein